MKRTFIAVKIKPKDKLLKTYTKLKNELDNEKIKWVNSDNFHLTLFFLGDTSEEKIEEVKNQLSNIADQYAVFSVKLKGIGVFKNLNKPRVLWVGINQYEMLQNLKTLIDKEMTVLGFHAETREFKPHLTLARMKWINDKQKLSQLLEEYKSEFFQQTEIKELIYFESVLRSTGPIYKPIEKYMLA